MIGYILFHEGVDNHIAFDILVREDYYEKNKDYFEELKKGLYTTDCEYVDKFMSKYAGYIYLGSEDLAHYIDLNVAHIILIHELLEKGFGIVVMDGEELTFLK